MLRITNYVLGFVERNIAYHTCESLTKSRILSRPFDAVYARSWPAAPPFPDPSRMCSAVLGRTSFAPSVTMRRRFCVTTGDRQERNRNTSRAFAYSSKCFVVLGDVLRSAQNITRNKEKSTVLLQAHKQVSESPVPENRRIRAICMNTKAV